MKSKLFFLMTILLLLVTACLPAISPTSTSQVGSAQETTTQVTPAATLPSLDMRTMFDFSKSMAPIPIAGVYQFTEGPATDQNGNVYFSDVNAGRIYKWSPDDKVVIFLEGLNMPNGLMFDKSGNLIACEGGNGRLISISPQGQITVLVDQYNAVRFNETNDLWIDPQGGIYFTDPAYQSAVVQDGEHVYYLSPDRNRVMRVISNMVKPNGIVGTADGKTLYVADYGAGQTFAYTINSDGSLSDKRLFAPVGSDGMTLDTAGNLYLTTPYQVQIYDTAGNKIAVIPTQENPTNVTFAGTDGQTLFITARTAVYILQMAVEGSSTTGNPTSVSSTSGFTLTSPDLPSDSRIPAEYTCDGAASTLALEWSGAPDGTVGYAVIMHHAASPEDIHWYLVLYNLPAEVTSLPKNFTSLGTLGNNSVNGRTEYAPPCSKGPGDKTYTYTVYALSTQPQLSVPAAEVDRATLMAAIQDITLASAELNVIYARP